MNLIRKNVTLLNLIFSLSRRKKQIISLFVDSFFLFCSFFTVYYIIKFKSFIWINVFNILGLFFSTLFLTLLSFVKLGIYRNILRYLNFYALFFLFVGTLVSSIFLYISSFFFNENLSFTFIDFDSENSSKFTPSVMTLTLFDFKKLKYEIDRYIVDAVQGNTDEQYVIFGNYAYNA